MPVLTPQSLDALLELILQYFPDNTSGRILPADARAVLGELAETAAAANARLDGLGRGNDAQFPLKVVRNLAGRAALKLESLCLETACILVDPVVGTPKSYVLQYTPYVAGVTLRVYRDGSFTPGDYSDAAWYDATSKFVGIRSFGQDPPGYAYVAGDIRRGYVDGATEEQFFMRTAPGYAPAPLTVAGDEHWEHLNGQDVVGTTVEARLRKVEGDVLLVENDVDRLENEVAAMQEQLYAVQDRLDSTAFGTTADEKNRIAGRVIANNAGTSRSYAAGAAAMAAAVNSLVSGETFGFPFSLKLSYAGVNLVFPAGVKVRGNGCTLALDAGAQFLNGVIFTDNDVTDLHLATHASGFSNVSLLNTRWSGGSLDVGQLYHYASFGNNGNNPLFAGTITNAFDSTAIKRAVLSTKTATYRLTGATSYVSFGPAPGWGNVVLTVQNYTDAAPSAGATGPWPSFTNPVTDDDNNFYRATCEPGFRTAEVESTSNGGLTAQVATESQRSGDLFSLNVGIGPVEEGQVGWRLRAGGGRAAGPWLFNTVRFEAPSYVELLPNADFTQAATGDQATGWYLRPGIEMAGDGFARCTNPAENPHLRANVVSALKGNRSYTVRANITNSAGGSFNPQYQFNGQYINLPGFVGNGLHELTFTTPAGPDDTLANFIFYMNAAGMEIDSVSLTLNP